MDAKNEPLSPLALWILRAYHEIRRLRLAHMALAASLALAACTAVTTLPYRHPVRAPMAAPAVDASTAPVSYPEPRLGAPQWIQGPPAPRARPPRFSLRPRFGGESPTCKPSSTHPPEVHHENVPRDLRTARRQPARACTHAADR
jgi:hypothetical protein